MAWKRAQVGALFANQSRVVLRPTLAGTRGSQPRAPRARVMSGQRCLGSSSGSGSKASLPAPPERWVDERVAVDLGGRGEHDPCPLRQREAQGVVRPEGPDLEDGDRYPLEVRGARRRGEVVDLVEAPGQVYVRRDVVVDVLEVGGVTQVGDVIQATGAEVVHADHAVSFGEQPLAQVAAHETRAAGYQGTGGLPSHGRSPCSSSRLHGR